jgi:processive 1,2-diacylglycerol beta-glucosyltransferase
METKNSQGASDGANLSGNLSASLSASLDADLNGDLGASTSDSSSANPIANPSANSSENSNAELPPKILVFHASVGSGHRTAAEAVAQALKGSLDSENLPDYVPRDTEILLEDSLDYARWYIDGDKTASSFIGPTRPLYDIFWRYFLTGRLLWNGGTAWSRLMFPKFTHWVAENKPAAVVCTHITAANIAVGARIINKQNYPIVCVPTDYEIEGQFPHKYTDLFCVATEYMAETLRARKIDNGHIKITGIPARSDFSKTYDRLTVRERWGLPKDKIIVLILSGATIPRPYKRLRATLDEFLPYLRRLENIHFVFLSGTDKSYEATLRGRIREEEVNNATVLDYVDEMAPLMAASDLAICKAGGLVVTECLNTKTPMILIGQAYAQEKVNVRMLTSMGAAIHVQTPREIFEALCFATGSEGGIAAMHSMGERYFRHPDAAKDIASESLRLAFLPTTDELELRKKWHGVFYFGNKPAHVR